MGLEEVKMKIRNKEEASEAIIKCLLIFIPFCVLLSFTTGKGVAAITCIIIPLISLVTHLSITLSISDLENKLAIPEPTVGRVYRLQKEGTCKLVYSTFSARKIYYFININTKKEFQLHLIDIEGIVPFK